MLRDVFHRIVAYKKRIGRRLIKVEYLDGDWWTFVFVDAVEKHHNPSVVLCHRDEYDGNFSDARRKGLNHIVEHT